MLLEQSFYFSPVGDLLLRLQLLSPLRQMRLPQLEPRIVLTDNSTFNYGLIRRSQTTSIFTPTQPVTL